MTAAKAATPPARAANWVRLSFVPGAELDIGICRWSSPELAGASYHLLCLLGEVTGRLQPSAAGGYSVVAAPSGEWPKLIDLPPAEIATAVQRIRGQYASIGWELDAPGSAELDVVTAIDVHFGRAQRRWQQERAT